MKSTGKETRKWVFALIGILILATVLLALGIGLQNTDNPLQNSADSIILKIPVTQIDNPSDLSADHTILGYNDKAVALGEEFAIDPSNIDFGECAPEIVFRLDGVQENSIALSISEMQFMNGETHSQGNYEEFNISDGNCIGVSPMCTDVAIYYCFELKKDVQGNIEAYYSVDLRGIMPYPIN